MDGQRLAGGTPGRVLAVVLRSITTHSPAEMDCVYRGGAAHLRPEAWADFGTMVEDGGDPVTACAGMLEGADDRARLGAALAWCRWELGGMRAEPGSEMERISSNPGSP